MPSKVEARSRDGSDNEPPSSIGETGEFSSDKDLTGAEIAPYAYIAF